jgi:hypothetical protein
MLNNRAVARSPDRSTSPTEGLQFEICRETFGSTPWRGQETTATVHSIPWRGQKTTDTALRIVQFLSSLCLAA